VLSAWGLETAMGEIPIVMWYLALNGRCFKGSVLLQSKRGRGVISLYAEMSSFSVGDGTCCGIGV
jgi:hypothetical protein